MSYSLDKRQIKLKGRPKQCYKCVFEIRYVFYFKIQNQTVVDNPKVVSTSDYHRWAVLVHLVTWAWSSAIVYTQSTIVYEWDVRQLYSLNRSPVVTELG